MIQRVAVLVGAGVLLWLLLGLPAWLLWGDVPLVQSLTALGLTLVPSAATLAWVSWVYRRVPDLQLMAGMGGTVLRMAVALGGGFALASALPDWFGDTFWFWLLVFYLVLLAVEITILVRAVPPQDGKT